MPFPSAVDCANIHQTQHQQPDLPPCLSNLCSAFPLSLLQLPQNYQVDWEAILARSPIPFIQSVSPWLYPPAAKEAPQPPTGAGMAAESARVEEVLMQASQPELEAAQAAAQADTAGEQQILEGTSFLFHLYIQLLCCNLREGILYNGGSCLICG